MSAKLLQLPKKPTELADDLESFIYVLCAMILCYHAHSMSPTNVAGNSREFTPGANARNVTLAKYLDDMFYSNTISGRYHYGGDRKLSQIVQGSPTFKPEDPHLKEGITKLYKLLKQHYKALPIDDALQARWGIPVLSAPMLAVPTPGPTPNPLGDRFDLAIVEISEPGSPPPPAFIPLPALSAPPPETSSAEGWSAEASSESPPDNGAAGSLDTHADITKIFADKDFKGQGGVWDPGYLKTYSQFVDLPNPDGSKGTGFASSLVRSSARSSAASSKRALESHSGEGERDAKRAKVKGSSRVEQGPKAARRSRTKSGAGAD